MEKAINFFVLLIGSLLVLQPRTTAMKQFFPELDANLTKVTWAHAVNDRSKLQTALNSSVMMLEADVVEGKVNGTGETKPIMGHPPAVVSDLSLEDFLNLTYAFNEGRNSSERKGVKLDFKSTDVFTKSVDVIKPLYSSIDYPLWINADIIRGPTNLITVPVDPDTFLSTAKVFSESVLSLGWTTTIPVPLFNVYTDGQIREMIEAISRNDVKQDITFAVRAGIAAESLEQVRALKEEVANCTLTIWSSEGDYVNIEKLRTLILEWEVDRVYIDVPKALYDQLNLGSQG